MTNQSEFWELRWQNKETGWDIGAPAPALIQYFRQWPNRDARVLIPGCGSAHEALWLLENGFSQITLIDISPTACQNISERMGHFPGLQILCEDFFAHSGQYDWIVEQTFFCAIPPEMRDAYVRKMHELLVPGGKLAGLLFGITFEKAGPPFGGSASEYRNRFSPFFNINRLETCTDSIPPRMGNELWFEFQKPIA